MKANEINGAFPVYWMDGIEFSQEFVKACNSLRNKPGVYCFWIGDVPVYVGKSNNLGGRMFSSYSDRHKNYISHPTTVSWICCGSADAGILELYYISAYSPILNKKDNNGSAVTLRIEPLPTFGRKIYVLENGI
jgi:excinuclease UvrABC nuclease subunit